VRSGRDVERPGRLGGRSPIGRRARASDAPLARVACQEQVLAHRHVEHEPLRLAVCWDEAESRRHRVGRAAQTGRPAGHLDCACRVRLEAEERAEHIAAARADETREPDDLAGPDIEADPTHPARDGEIAHAQDRAFERVGPPLLERERVELAAEHERDQPPLVELLDRSASDERPVPEDGETVAQREDLPQPVRDEHRGDAAALQRPDGGEERLDLVVRERARRLVEDEHAGVGRESAGDLDHLLQVRSQPADGRVEVDRAAERVEQRARSAPRVAPVDAEPRPGLSRAEEDVLDHRQVVHQRAFLRHRRDAGGECLRCVAEAGLVPVEDDPTPIRGDLCGDDLQQRGLARPVLAAEPVHLAGEQRHARAAERPRAAVVLVQILGHEHGCGSQGRRFHASALETLAPVR
jgi:hypothetical protein